MPHLDENMDYIRENDTIRWLGYFDLLGTRDLISSGEMRQVLWSFRKALKTLDNLNRLNRHHARVFSAWFSDTFIIYSADPSLESFAAVEQVCRLFMIGLIGHDIPVAGSISCGRFYADRANGLYLGPALVEAYEWYKNQDWIGLLLCPSCIGQLEEVHASANDYKHYVECADRDFIKSSPDASCRFLVCILGDGMKEGGTENVLLSNLRRMRDEQRDERTARKYSRTIDFIERNQRGSQES